MKDLFFFGEYHVKTLTISIPNTGHSAELTKYTMTDTDHTTDPRQTNANGHADSSSDTSDRRLKAEKTTLPAAKAQCEFGESLRTDTKRPLQ